ncbi:hypothetical protein K3727_04875 [Rhodobacteraceae bacterium M382]|nr:hypothetical protein K3727_04875 [Rhodobacteraceae bacterium M382]
MARLNLLLILSVCAASNSSWAQEQPAAGWLTRLELKEHQKLMTLMSQGEELAPFTTDGCSGGMSWIWERAVRNFPELGTTDGTRPEWENCCVIHDQAYHDASGATQAEESYLARLMADQELQSCIRDIASRPISVGVPLTPDLGVLYERLSVAMFWAVRFGGEPCSGLPWRWGYGYPNC